MIFGSITHADIDKNMSVKILLLKERKLQMADRSKNEQFDIVAQAEKVLADYIKKYFNMGKKAPKKKLLEKIVLPGLTALAIGICIYCIFLCCI